MSERLALELVVAIVLPALVLLLAYWRKWHLVAALAKRSGGVLREPELGLAELQLLPGWRPTALAAIPSALQAADPLRRRYLLVISESRADFTDDMDLREYCQRTFAGLTGTRRVLEIRGPEPRHVAGFQALQTEAVTADNRTLVTYLHTAIEGERGFHQVIAWATPSTYDRRVFERLLDGFVELPGPKPVATLSHGTPPTVTPRSRYDVH